MANKWSTFKGALSKPAQARVEARVAATLKSMPLAEVRKAIGMTQVELAGRLELSQGNVQGNVSELEHAADMYLTTLRKYVEALGGELHLTARFADGRELEIGQLAELGPG